MKTVKLRIEHFECMKELKQFNSILRYAYNRFTEWKSYWDKLFFATKPCVAVTFEITGVTNSSHDF